MKYTLTIETDDAADVLRVVDAITVPEQPATPATAQVAEPPAPTPAAPEQSAPTPAAPDGTLDVRGYPWDDRIHASSKALNADGTWRYRRNTPKETIEAVEAELKPIAEQQAPASAPAAPGEMPPLPENLQRTEQALASAPAAPEQQAPAAITYEQIVALLTEKLRAGSLTPATLPEFWSECGVADVNGLRDNPDALSKAYTKLALLP